MNVQQYFQRLLDWRPKSAATPAAPEPRATTPPAPRSRQRVVALGIDFGTSGTKVAFRDITEAQRPVRVVDFGTRTPGLCRFSRPSTIVLDGAALLTGDEAEEAKTGEALRSVKRLLIDEEGAPPGFRDALARAGGAAAKVDDATAFAASVLVAESVRHAAGLLVKQFPGLDMDREVLINLAAPVQVIDESAPSPRYREVLEVGVEMGLGMGATTSLERLAEAWLDARADSARGVQRRGGRDTVYPEALAVLGGLRTTLLAPDYRNRMVVDVGAGTTDVSVFRVTPHEHEELVCFYAGGSVAQGGDEVDRALAQELGIARPSSRLLSRMRKAKRRLVSGRTWRVQTPDGVRELTPDCLGRAADRLRSTVRTHVGSVFGRAFGRNRAQEAWRELETLVVGGGALAPAVRDLLEGPVEKRPFCNVRLLPPEEWESVRPEEVVGESVRAPELEELPFIAAAVGLSWPSQMLPVYRPPTAVGYTRFHPQDSGTYDGDADSLYAK